MFGFNIPGLLRQAHGSYWVQCIKPSVAPYMINQMVYINSATHLGKIDIFLTLLCSGRRSFGMLSMIALTCFGTPVVRCGFYLYGGWNTEDVHDDTQHWEDHDRRVIEEVMRMLDRTEDDGATVVEEEEQSHSDDGGGTTPMEVVEVGNN